MKKKKTDGLPLLVDGPGCWMSLARKLQVGRNEKKKVTVDRSYGRKNFKKGI